MLAGVCGGSSAPTWLIQTVLHALLPELQLGVFHLH